MAQAARNLPREPRRSQNFGVNGPAANDNTELSTSATFHGNRNRARRQAQEIAKDPNEADRLEIEEMKARVEQFDSKSDPSLTAKQNGQGDIELNLKFDVPIPGVAGSPAGPRSQIKKSIPSSQPSTRSTTENEAPSPMSNQPNTSDSEGGSNKMNDTQDELKKAMEEERDRMFSTSPQKKDSNTEQGEAPPFTDEQTPENDEPVNEEDTPEDESTTEGNQEGTENIENTESEEKKSAQGGQAAENASFEIEKEKKEQEEKEEALKQQEQEQREGMAQAAQEAQKQAQQQQDLFGEYAKAVRKKQNLDRKLSRLKLERFAVWLALRIAKTFKAILDFIQNLLWKGGIACMGSCILFLLGILCFILYGLLWIFKGPLIPTIALLKMKLNSLDEDIKKTKENQQKAISVIQSIQRKKRTGTAKQAPKFNAPQQA